MKCNAFDFLLIFILKSAEETWKNDFCATPGITTNMFKLRQLVKRSCLVLKIHD